MTVMSEERRAFTPERTVTDVAIVGAGYVGLPLAQVFADAGRSVLLVDVSPERVAAVNRGESYIEDVPPRPCNNSLQMGSGRRRAPRRRRGFDPDHAADAALPPA